MSESEPLKQNIADPDHWIRVLMILVCVVAFYVASIVLGLAVLVNAIVLLVTGERNDRLAGFGAQLAAYLSALARFGSLDSEERPFPFGDWPDTRPRPAPPLDNPPPAPDLDPVPRSEPAPAADTPAPPESRAKASKPSVAGAKAMRPAKKAARKRSAKKKAQKKAPKKPASKD